MNTPHHEPTNQLTNQPTNQTRGCHFDEQAASTPASTTPSLPPPARTPATRAPARTFSWLLKRPPQSMSRWKAGRPSSPLSHGCRGRRGREWG